MSQYMFRAGLLLIIRRMNSVYTAVGIVMRYADWLLAVEDYYWLAVGWASALVTLTEVFPCFSLSCKANARV
jgi:hypothetical protein